MLLDSIKLMKKEENFKKNNFNINFNEDKISWDRFVKKSPQRSIFVYTDFLDSLNYEYKLITTYDSKRIVMGTIILLNKDKNPLLEILPFNLYQGILFGKNRSDIYHKSLSYNLKVLEFSLQSICSQYENLCICNSYHFNDLRAFSWHNFDEIDKKKFNTEIFYTGIIKKELYLSFEEYIKNIRSVRRQEFKKASKELTIKSSTDWFLLLELYKKTLNRQDISISKEEELLLPSIVKNALIKGYGEMFIAYLDKKPISAVFFLNDDRTVYYLIGASDPKYRNKYGSTFLLLNFIKTFFKSDFEEFDFLGTNSPYRGDYKLSFNCELTQFSFLKI